MRIIKIERVHRKRSAPNDWLFPFIAVLQDQNDVANDIAQSEKLHPSHRNHSLPGAGFDRRIQNMYPFQCTLLMIITHPAEYCQDSKTEKKRRSAP